MHTQQSRHFRQQIDPSGGGTRAGDQRRHQRHGQTVRRDILRHIAGLQHRADHLGPPAVPQGGDRGVVEQGALADHCFPDTLAVRHDAATRVVQRQGAKFHCVGFAKAGAGFSGKGAPRRTAMISAMMDAAISGAVTASIFSPTGPRIRVMLWSE